MEMPNIPMQEDLEKLHEVEDETNPKFHIRWQRVWTFQKLRQNNDKFTIVLLVKSKAGSKEKEINPSYQTKTTEAGPPPTTRKVTP